LTAAGYDVVTKFDTTVKTRSQSAKEKAKTVKK